MRQNNKQIRYGCIFGALLALMLYVKMARAQNETISLKGNWAFAFDTQGIGVGDRWFAKPMNQDSIPLPGTTETAKKGVLNKKTDLKRLSRVYPYKGKVWFQRTIDIPQSWNGKHVTLLLERTKTTHVWLDTCYLGKQNSLATEHVYDLSKQLAPGKHRLTICVDNKDLPPVGDPHQLSDQTQTNWNGIIGRIELMKTGKVWFDEVKLFPDVSHGKVKVMVKLNSMSSLPSQGTMEADGVSFNISEHRVIPRQQFDVAVARNEWSTFEVTVPDALLWDEFHPALYRMNIRFTPSRKGRKSLSKGISASEQALEEVEFGMREFKVIGTQFAINGKTIFLRGKHDACVFPLTGYAPMDVEGWVRVMRIAKSYGINHYRFHTWCPPAAAFKAADIVGIYMQPELPVWGSIGGPAKRMKGDVEQRVDSDPVQARVDYLRQEGLCMLKSYSHYPSFVMMALGNEMGGSMDAMAGLINDYRQYDPTKLYAQGSNNFLNNPRQAKGDDYWTTTMTGGHYSTGKYEDDTNGKEVRGSYPVHTKGHVNNLDCGTMYDYSLALKGVTVPVIGHEVGQYEVYPDFKEISKYTGVTRARNFEVFQRRLKQAGMLPLADDFVKASGALAVNCYREDIETALRTPGFGGFQLLDLQDFPGQGTALVGILDAFMDSKGLIKPDEWRQFCSEVVPLAKMPSRIWKATDTFTAQIDIAHYGDKDLAEECTWMLTDEQGKVLEQGALAKKLVQQGGLRSLGTLCFTLNSLVKGNQRLLLTLQLGKYRNSYPLWVYDVANDYQIKKGKSGTVFLKNKKKVWMATEWNQQTMKLLAQGKNVLLVADSAHLQKSVSGAFITDFWCYPMFKKYGPPGTMGLLIDDKHSVFDSFPRANHSDWQWWRMAKGSPVMNLGLLQQNLHPLVRVIDNFATNRQLGVLFEANVGKGKLVVTSINLMDEEHPEVEALRNSVIDYMTSDRFVPQDALTEEALAKLFRK